MKKARLEPRLRQELSPYLRQHAFDPVDWYPWGEEAIAKARREDRPIFLSVGYSTCYFCHLMGRETFADPGVAEFLNAHFVNVLVDREERPDVDEIYSAATQIYSHRGGWPNTVFLTPRLEPFFCGGYFPRDGQPENPSFSHVAVSMAEAWKSRRAEVEEQARELSRVMRSFLEAKATAEATAEAAAEEPAEATAEQIPSGLADAALVQLEEIYDAEHGGFGQGAKFPLAPALLLLEELAPERPRAAAMLEATLEHMARGGIFDQVGGGFHRYATDRQWKIPHFEKTLGENGLLLEIYARRYVQSGDPELARTARGISEFFSRELAHPRGAHGAAAGPGHLEAPLFQAWRLDELVAALGDEEAGYLAPILGFDRPPFFERDYYVLHLPEPLVAQAERRRMDYETLAAEVQAAREKLFDARSEIKPPFIDGKIRADHNGLAIAGLAVAGGALGEPALVERARRCADFLLEHLRPGGVLRHVWHARRDAADDTKGMTEPSGEARHGAFLADYVFLVRGLLALHEASDEERWLALAVELSEEQITRLGDPAGGFKSAPEGADQPPWQTREIYDGALPAANAAAVLNLLELDRRTRSSRWRELAAGALRSFAAAARRPDGTRTLAVAVRRFNELS